MKKLFLLLAALLAQTAFAQTTITALPAASALGGTEVTPCDQSGTTKKCSVAQINSYIVSQGNGTGLVALSSSPSLTTPAITGSSTGVTTIGSANAGASNYTATLPAATDTLVELAQTQTLTNKSIAASEVNSGTLSAAQMPALTGDCTTTAGAVATTCTKTSGTAFGTFATQNYATPPAIGGTTPAAGAFTTLATSSPNTNTQAIAANTYGDGLLMINSNTATASNQMYSPGLHFRGQGWKTNATAASETVDGELYLVPTQGSSTPGATLTYCVNINGGGCTTVIQIGQGGNVTAQGIFQGPGFYNQGSTSAASCSFCFYADSAISNSQSIASNGVRVINFAQTLITTYEPMTLVAGTTTTAPLGLTSGTNLTTATAGDFEYDGTVGYFTPTASSRGVMLTDSFEAISSAYTLTSQTAAQKLLNGTTNGTITVPVGTFTFTCNFTLTSMSATSGSFGFALGGTATFTQAWTSVASMPSSTLPTATASYQTYNTAANTSLTAASTVADGIAQINGIVRVTVAGTIIPEVSLTVAAAAVVGTNSSCEFKPVGSSTVVSVGNWN